MAQIWFTDIDKDLKTKSTINVEDFKISLINLYETYEKMNPEVFKDFRPIIISDNDEIDFNEVFFQNWQENKDKIPFIVQGGNFEERYMSWGNQVEEYFDNKLIQTFTNDLMKLFGEDSYIIFEFAVNADDGYENYIIDIKPNFNSDTPNIIFEAEFRKYEDDEN